MKQYSRVVGLWQSYKIASTEDLDKYLDSFRILFAFHSGKIENQEITYHDTREIFENSRVVSYTGSPRALFEQQNQKLCYEVLKEKIVKKEPLSLELAKEIHNVLTSGTYDERRYIENEERPGEFKKYDYVTGVHEVGSAAENVENDLEELIAPPLIVYDEDKRMYYECLQKYDEAEELNTLYEFLKHETGKTWEKALTLADGMKLERKDLSDFTQSI